LLSSTGAAKSQRIDWLVARGIECRRCATQPSTCSCSRGVWPVDGTGLQGLRPGLLRSGTQSHASWISSYFRLRSTRIWFGTALSWPTTISRHTT